MHASRGRQYLARLFCEITYLIQASCICRLRVHLLCVTQRTRTRTGALFLRVARTLNKHQRKKWLSALFVTTEKSVFRFDSKGQAVHISVSISAAECPATTIAHSNAARWSSPVFTCLQHTALPGAAASCAALSFPPARLHIDDAAAPRATESCVILAYLVYLTLTLSLQLAGLQQVRKND